MYKNLRITTVLLFLTSLILGIALIGCVPSATAVEDVQPVEGSVIDDTITQPTAEPTATTEPVATAVILSDEEAIQTALGTHLNVDPSTLTVFVESNTGTHARGGVDNGYFLAAKVNGSWVIVADGQGVMDCNAIAQYAFPTSMVPECESTQLDATTLEGALGDHLGVDPGTLTIVVESNTGTHARGGVDNGYFLAAKVNGSWVIVADGQGMMDCNAIAQYAFPALMVPECQTTQPDTTTFEGALAAHLGVEASTLTIIVDTNTGTHARGGVDNGYFLAAKVNGNWVIIADGQGAIDCDVVAQYSFPTSMVPECADLLSDEAAIQSALGAHLGVDPNTLTIIIETNTGTHARGSVDNGYFLAAQVNGNWMIVADGQGVINCDIVAQYGFPVSMTPECL